MTETEILLCKVTAKCFREAKQWYGWYLRAQLLILVFAIIALFVSLDPPISTVIGLISVLAIEGLRWRSDLWKAEGESFKRQWEHAQGFGEPPPAAVLADWLAGKSADFLDDVGDDAVRGAEFDSRSPVGPRRVVENVQESAWWTKHECRRGSQVLLVGLVVFVFLGFAVLLVNLTGLRAAASAIALARNVGGIVCAFFTVLFSVNIVRLLTEFREFAHQADEVFKKSGMLLRSLAISERDALLVLHAYQNARSAAPLIPTRIWLKHGAHLRAQWRRLRPPA